MQDKCEAACDNDTAKPASIVSPVRNQLLALGEEQEELLQGIISSYVQRMGLAEGNEARPVAQEILQESIVEALDHADSFDPGRQLVAWLLGIALNRIRHRKVEAAKRQQRELSFSQLSRLYAEPIEGELPAQFTISVQPGPEEIIVSDEQAKALLSLVSTDDQQVLRLAFLEDFSRDALAHHLGLTPGAVRVRLHRALASQRAAWIA